MPSLSGQIFTLGAEAGFNEGFVKGRVGGQAGTTLTADAEVCHGINLQADIELKAELEGKLTLLLPSIRGEVAALASAGVAGQLKIDPNLFEQFGLTANIEAAAEASVAGRLAIGLDAEVLSQLGANYLDGLALELFFAFLREVTIEAGVWGKASYSAMARAHLELNGRILTDEDAGFTFQAGYAVGLEGGYGCDYFCGVNFDSIRRFYTVAVDLINKEVCKELRRQLPPPLKPGVEFVDLLLPVCLHTAYDLGQRTVLEGIGTPEGMIEPFLRAFAEQLQRYLIDKTSEVADRMLSELIDGVLLLTFGDRLSQADRSSAEESTRSLIDLYQNGRIDVEKLPDAIGHLTDIVHVLGGDALDLWRRPLTLMWTALAAGHALRDIGRAVAGAGGSVLGIGAYISAQLRPMPAVVPQLVLDEYNQTLTSFGGSNVQFADAINYLVEVGISPLIDIHLPELKQIIEVLGDMFDISPGEVAEAGLRGATGENLTNLALYHKLKAFCRTQIDGLILDELFPTLTSQVDNNPDAMLYIEEVARPSFKLLSDFIFDRLDVVVGNISSIDQLPFLETMGKGLSMVIYKILVRNVVVLDHIISSHMYESLYQGFGQLKQTVSSDRTNIMVTSARDTVFQYIPGIPTLTDDQVEALQEFLAALLDAGQQSFSKEILSDGRLERLRELKLECLLSIGGEIDWTLDRDVLLTTYENFLTCAYIPNPIALRDLALLQSEILLDQLKVVLQLVPPALAKFVLEISFPIVKDIESQVKAYIAEAEDLLETAKAELTRLRDEAEIARSNAREAAELWKEQLEDLEELLSDEDLLDTIESELKEQGETNLSNGAADLGLSGDTVDQFIDTFVDVTFPAAWLIAKPLVSTALTTIASASGILADAIEEALTTEEAIHNLEDSIFAAFIGDPPPPAFTVTVGTLTALSPDDFFTVVKEAVKTLAVDPLSTAMDYRLEELSHIAEAEDYESQASTQQTTVDNQEKEVNDIKPIGNASIQILSPSQLSPDVDKVWSYGPSVPLSIIITGVKPSYVRDDRSRRIRVSLNGEPLSYEASDWSYNKSSSTISWATVLKHGEVPLRAGPNLLEVSIADGTDEIDRETVFFLADLTAVENIEPLYVAEDLSQFDPPGNDHLNTYQEYVTLMWNGSTSLSLKGWRIQDRDAVHIYRFGEVTLAPGELIKIHTGGHPSLDTESDVHWGREAAVWNNRGDAVYIIDANNVLRAEHVYQG